MPKVTIFLPQTEFTNPQVNNYYLLSKTEDSFVFKPIFSTDLPTNPLAINTPMFSIEVNLSDEFNSIIEAIEKTTQTQVTDQTLFAAINTQRQEMLTSRKQSVLQTKSFCKTIHRLISTSDNLRDYQIKTLVNTMTQVCLGHNFCLWSWPTGTGKNHIAIMLTKEMLALGLNVMFIAASRLMAEETAKQLEEFNAKVSTPREVKSRLQDKVIICLSVSLGVSLADTLNQNPNSVTADRIVFLDEAHQNTKTNAQYYQNNFQANIFIAMSATPQPLLEAIQDKNKQFQTCGELTISNAALQGYITPVRAIEIVVPANSRHASDTINTYYLQAILFLLTTGARCPVTNTDFRDKITLVKVYSRTIGNRLYGAIEAFKKANQAQAESIGEVLPVYTSKVDKREAADFYNKLNNFRQGNPPIVIACQAGTESINVPNLSLGIVTTCSATELQQFAGRLVRKPDAGYDKPFSLLVYIRIRTEGITRQGIPQQCTLSTCQLGQDPTARLASTYQIGNPPNEPSASASHASFDEQPTPNSVTATMHYWDGKSQQATAKTIYLPPLPATTTNADTSNAASSSPSTASSSKRQQLQPHKQPLPQASLPPSVPTTPAPLTEANLAFFTQQTSRNNPVDLKPYGLFVGPPTINPAMMHKQSFTKLSDEQRHQIIVSRMHSGQHNLPGHPQPPNNTPFFCYVHDPNTTSSSKRKLNDNEENSTETEPAPKKARKR